MKANELRIGNLVFYGLDALSIVSIDSQRSIPQAGLETAIRLSDDSAPWLNNVNPIHLDEEWLVKLGFEGNEDERHIVLGLGGGEELSVELLTKTCCLTRSNKMGQDDFVYIKYPDYVHQLQNLYHALTGKELEVQP